MSNSFSLAEPKVATFLQAHKQASKIIENYSKSSAVLLNDKALANPKSCYKFHYLIDTPQQNAFTPTRFTLSIEISGDAKEGESFVNRYKLFDLYPQITLPQEVAFCLGDFILILIFIPTQFNCDWKLLVQIMINL